MVQEKLESVANNIQVPRHPTTTLFELPRPRRRRRCCTPEAAKAGYWHRRAISIEKTLASVSREATEAKEASTKATTKIAAMEMDLINMKTCLEDIVQRTSAASTETKEEEVTARSEDDDELEELMAVQIQKSSAAASTEAREEEATAQEDDELDELMAVHTHEHTHTPHPHTPEGAESGSSRGSAKGSSPSTDLECGGSPGGVRARPHIVDDTHGGALLLAQAQERDVPVQALSDALAHAWQVRAARRLRSACIGPGHREAMRRRQVAQEAKSRQQELDFERALSRDVYTGGFC